MSDASAGVATTATDHNKINDAFMAAWDEFGDDKSTEFLISIVADRLGIEYGDVTAGLAEIHNKHADQENCLP